MSTLIDKVSKAWYSAGHIIVVTEGGVEIRFPVSRNPIFRNAKEAELNNIEVSPYGLHWPDLDEDLSFKGLLEGRFGA